MRKRLIYTAVFVIGGSGYACIELIWRGRTHWSMAAAGGLCMFTLFMIYRRFRTVSLLQCAVIGALVITLIEFAAGCIINNWLGLKIWDYSDQKWNIMGQICPLYTVFWGLLSLPVSRLCMVLNDFYENENGGNKHGLVNDLRS